MTNRHREAVVVTRLAEQVKRAAGGFSPLDGSEVWVVLDPGLVMHREASDFVRALHGVGWSIHTIRAYAGRVAGFLGWCADQGLAWSSITLSSWARLKHFVEATPHRDGRLRSGATVNAILTAACEFLRFCARTGVIERAVADRLSEPRWQQFTPPGFDAGESGQFRMVRTRTLKARAAAFPRRSLPSRERIAACCRRPREQFMVALLRDGRMFSRVQSRTPAWFSEFVQLGSQWWDVIRRNRCGASRLARVIAAGVVCRIWP